jgi:hypothetical protein
LVQGRKKTELILSRIPPLLIDVPKLFIDLGTKAHFQLSSVSGPQIVNNFAVGAELLPERVSPELRHLQAELAAQLPYRQAAALLVELLSETGGLNYATTRNRTLAVGKRIEEEIRREIDHPPCCPRTG